MDVGFILSVVLGLGVAGHAVVGIILTTHLAVPTRRLWSRFGRHRTLLRLNGLLLLIASVLHLGVSWIKAADATSVVFWSSILPFPFFVAAGVFERRLSTRWPHHVVMATGWGTFAWHGTVAG